MSWELDYERGWTELVRPAFLSLADRTKELVKDVAMTCTDQPQNQARSMDWPADGQLQKQFADVPKEELAKVITVVYYYGHWYSGKHTTADKSWTAPDYLVDDSGGYWKFELLAKQSYIARFPGERWEDTYRLPELKPTYYKHEEGTSLCDEELTYKYQMQLAGTLYDVLKVTHVNFHPHPFVIGVQHFPKDGGMYINPEQAPCAMPGCGLSYADHTSDHVLMLQLNRGGSHDEANAVLVPLVSQLEADELDGVALVKNSFKLTGGTEI